MKETSQRLRSLAPPTRDKIFIWSAVVAGCGIMALLGRHAAITRFGTDEFTGNVLFAVFLVLTIGLYCGFQSAIESLFDRIFRKKESVALMSTLAGEEIEVTVVDDPRSKMEFTAPIENTAVEEEPDYTDDEYSEDYSGGEIVEDKEPDEARYVLMDGKEVYEGPIDVDDVVFVELEHNIREYSSLQERIELRGDYPYFEDYIGGHGLEDVLESDTLYNEWVSLRPSILRKSWNSAYIVSAHIPKVMIQSVVLPRPPKRTASSRMTARYASRNGRKKHTLMQTAMSIIPIRLKPH